MNCHCNLLVGAFHSFGVEYVFHGLVLENKSWQGL